MMVQPPMPLGQVSGTFLVIIPFFAVMMRNAGITA